MNALPNQTDKHIWAVYVCGGEKGGSPVKVGYSKDPYKRKLAIQTCWPGKVQMHYTFWVTTKKAALAAESSTKWMLRHHRLHGELFGLHAREAALAIKSVFSDMGIGIDWLPDNVHSDQLGSFKYKGKSAWNRISL